MRKFFIPTDPQSLDFLVSSSRGWGRGEKSTRTSRDHRRKIQESIRQMRGMLQALPPRELDILFSLEVADNNQDEIKGRFRVHQPNISYRLEQARNRLLLSKKISSICSDTFFRSTLYAAGLSEPSVQAILGIVKTTCQSATAKILGITQGSVRYLFLRSMKILEGSQVEGVDKVLEVMNLVSRNYNKRRVPRTQGRWSDKIKGTNTTTPRTPFPDF